MLKMTTVPLRRSTREGLLGPNNIHRPGILGS